MAHATSFPVKKNGIVHGTAKYWLSVLSFALERECRKTKHKSALLEYDDVS